MCILAQLPRIITLTPCIFLKKSYLCTRISLPQPQMTDQEYINAFRTDDQQTMTRFYNAFRADFLKAISSKFAIKDDDQLAEIFQDTCIRLWCNIQGDRLTSDSLTSSLAGYLYGIGERVALEILRKNKGKYGPPQEESIPQPPSFNFQDDPYYLWLVQVDEPMRRFSPKHTQEECQAEWERLNSLYMQHLNGKPVAIPEWLIPDSLTAYEREERYKRISIIVSRMGEPCAPLLQKFYWEGLSWSVIAAELQYANADSAKTQKNRCMNKLKTYFANHHGIF